MTYTFESHKNKELFPLSTMSESVSLKPILSEGVTLAESEGSKDKKKALIVEMEAIHVGKTENHIFYTEQGLRDGINSWTHPYQKPVLTHHNQEYGEPIGRILSAEFKKSPLNGREGVFLKVSITDPVAQEKVLDGRYQTVSIGSRTDKATCNICGTNRAEEWCEHWKGETYEGVQCHYATGTVEGIEVSYVNNPADKDAGNVSVSFAEQTVLQVSEGEILDPRNPEKNFYLNLQESEKEEADKKISLLLGESTKKFVNNKERENMKLQEALDKISLLEENLEETKKRSGELAIELKKNEEQLAEMEKENENLLKENTELKKTELSSLIESVVDMKVKLNKPGTRGVEREDLIEEHAQRSEESLRDLQSDLKLEIEEMKNQNSRKKVQDPTGASENNEGDEGQFLSEQEANKLFRGLFNKGGN